MFDPKNWITSSTVINIVFYIYERTSSFQLHDSKKKTLKAEQDVLDGVDTED